MQELFLHNVNYIILWKELFALFEKYLYISTMINFQKLQHGNILITETGKPNLYLQGHFYGVMTNNDAGTHINVRNGDYNLTFAVTDIGTINGTAGPWTLATALTELDSKIFKV